MWNSVDLLTCLRLPCKTSSHFGFNITVIPNWSLRSIAEVQLKHTLADAARRGSREALQEDAGLGGRKGVLYLEHPRGLWSRLPRQTNHDEPLTLPSHHYYQPLTVFFYCRLYRESGMCI
jgi:hypothetical protein